MKFRVGEIEQVSLSDAWAMFRYRAFIRLRDWINERIGRIDSSGAVLRLTSADDYRRMQEFRMEKSHRLTFPRIMYHVTKQSKMVRSEKQAEAFLRDGFDFRPVFSEPDVPMIQIAALQNSIKTVRDLLRAHEDIHLQERVEWRIEGGLLRRKIRDLEHDLENSRSVVEAYSAQEAFPCL